MNEPAAPSGRPVARLLTIPNLLSLLRLPLAILFIVTANPWARAVIILAAGVSDGIDGWLARKLKQHTGAGQIVDPITDKLFVLVALATLTAHGLIAPWMVLALLVRDIYTSFAFFIVKVLDWHVRFKARFSGKAVTVLQLAVMIAALLWPAAVVPLVVATALAAAGAIVDYTTAILAERRRAG